MIAWSAPPCYHQTATAFITKVFNSYFGQDKDGKQKSWNITHIDEHRQGRLLGTSQVIDRTEREAERLVCLIAFTAKSEVALEAALGARYARGGAWCALRARRRSVRATREAALTSWLWCFKSAKGYYSVRAVCRTDCSL